MSGTADNDDEMYSSYISKGRLVSMDEMLWGTGDYDSLDDDRAVILGQSGGEEYIAFGHVGSIIGDLGQNIVDGVEAAEDITYSSSGNGDDEHILSMGDDEVFCAQELQDNSDIEFAYSNSCDSEDIVLSYGLASKLNGIMIVCAVIRDYYRAAVSLGRIITQIMDYNEREYFRFLYDRGRSAN